MTGLPWLVALNVQIVTNAKTFTINNCCPGCKDKKSHCVSLHATCCNGTAPAGADASVGDCTFTSGTATGTFQDDLHCAKKLSLCVQPYCCMQANSSLPLRFWLDEYAFTPGETTLLKEEIEVCVTAAC